MATLALLSLLLVPSAPHTPGAQASSLRVESETTVSLETSAASSGQDDDVSYGETRRLVRVDEYLAHTGGSPTRVRRSFEEVSTSRNAAFAGNSFESQHEDPLDGAVLELSVYDGGELGCLVLEGRVPDEQTLFDDMLQPLGLEELLPQREPELGAPWDLESGAVARTLELALGRDYFAPSPLSGLRSEGELGPGRLGGLAGPDGPLSAKRMMRRAAWVGRATLASLDEQFEDERCVAIELEFAGLGEPQPLGGAPLNVQLEGRLLFSVASGTPVLLELAGTLSAAAAGDGIGQTGRFAHRSVMRSQAGLSLIR